MLKVKDLMQILQEMNEDDPIVMSSDPEGNCYRKLSERGVAKIIFRSHGYDGDIVSPDERQDGDVDAVCFWPS